MLISTTWEQQTSYDDGGTGTFAFVVLAIFGVLWELVGVDDFYGPLASIGVLIAVDLLIARRGVGFG